MEDPFDTTAEEIAQIELRAMPVMAKHFWLFYIITLVIASLACYHKIFTVLSHPAITTGVTTQLHKTYQTKMYTGNGHSLLVKSFARAIRFAYNGQSYNAAGGWDEEMGEGQKVTVLFNANHPEKAYELSWPGLIDFPVFSQMVPIWIVISGLLFAFAAADSHFTAFNFNLPNLTLGSFICLLVITVFIPLYPSADLLVFGKKADGVMTGDFECPHGHCVNAIVFTAGGNQYSAYSEYANEYEEGEGNHFPILYLPNNPNRCCIYQAGALYSNGYVVLMIFSIVVIVPWYIASRT